jgi:glyoxylase-like metal-dependent hydrolase (beta-lactamase superfamily II)
MAGGDLPRGVYAIPKLGFVNAYLVESEPGRLALVDTGTPGSTDKVLGFLETIGRKPSDVGHIVLTHADGDHSGSAAALRRATGAKLAIHELDGPRIAGEMRLKDASGAGSILMRAVSAFMRVERVKPDILLKDGDKIGELSVVHTPGHTDGSISIYRPKEILLVGDLLRTESNGELRLPSANMSRDMEELRRSVEKISQLDFEALLPGHGPPIGRGAKQAVAEFVARGWASH